MPTHDQLLDAEVAFILYNGQVYMTHPTDRDVSLPRLLEQVETLNHLPPRVCAEIDAFLRGGLVPEGLGLVGRYNMTNGRMAPYGPVNSPENQELVRNAISVASQSGPVSSPVGVSDDPASNMDSRVTMWTTSRQFMPLTDKVDTGFCPFCGQKRTLYHMKDGYLAQAMGIYGHGLCRDCLTTRMDQHEMTTGQKIEAKVSRRGFVRTSADVQDLFRKMQERVWMQQIAPYTKKLEEDREDPGNKDRAERLKVWWLKATTLIYKEHPEVYKLLPWLARTVTKGTPSPAATVPPEHAVDILTQAQAHLDRLRDDPRPEVTVPDLMRDFKGGHAWRQLEQWVYEQNAAQSAGDTTSAEQTVFDWPDGWTVKMLGADALGKEGELMGHCVGGYCKYVDAGDTLIYSLRDAKNEPHATIEIEGGKFLHPNPAPEGTATNGGSIYELDSDPGTSYQMVRRPPLAPTSDLPTGMQFHPHAAPEAWKVVQIQGKQDTEPVKEYQDRIKQWFTSLRNQGVDVEWADDALRPGAQYGDDEYVIDDISDVYNYWNDYIHGNTTGHHYPSEEGKEQDEYDTYGLPKKDWGSLYMSDIGGEVERAANEYIEEDDSFRHWGPHKLDLDPDELAEAFVFLAMQLDLMNKDTNHAGRKTAMKTLDEAVMTAYQDLDEKVDDMQQMNWDYHYQNLQEAYNNDYFGLNGPGEPGHIDEDPEHPAPRFEDLEETPYEHPTIEKAENELYDEYAKPYKIAREFLNALTAKLQQHGEGKWTGATPDYYQHKQNWEARPDPNAAPPFESIDPDDQTADIGGALSKWLLSPTDVL